VKRCVLSLYLKEKREGVSLKFDVIRQRVPIRSPADRKPREASVVLRRGSTRRWADDD